jgi:hypothetical protein
MRHEGMTIIIIDNKMRRHTNDASHINRPYAPTKAAAVPIACLELRSQLGPE